MTVTQLDLTNIVAAASSLSERIGNRLLEIDATQINENKESDERLKRWCQVVSQGNWEKFQQRLQWDGLDLDTVHQIINWPPITDNQILPSWAITLQEIIQAPANQDESKIPIEPENTLPFEDLLLPAIGVARQKLLNHLGSESLSSNCLPLDFFYEEAYLMLERSLLSSLVNLCENTLEFEFACFRPFGHSVISLLLTDLKTPPQKTHYERFVQKLLADGMLTFFQKYPVLGRLLATRIDFWVEATTEFMQRLKEDLAEITQVFQTNGENRKELSINQLGKVIEVNPNLSDPHNRGRSAIALTFESGLKLIYKPKDLGLDVSYNQLLDWCNQQGVPLTFKALKVLNRQTYGWVEYIEQLPIEDEAGAQRFYQRTGMLLCLLYALGATDCHYENLIASGEHLVLIDMETLMHHDPKLENFPQQQQQIIDNQLFWDSVLRTGMLPRWDFNKDKRIAYDISGLGSIDPQPSSWRILQWQFVNTDNMRRTSETITMPVKKNVPILNGVPLSPNDYLKEIVEGFDQMYRFLLEHQQMLLASECNAIQNSSSPLAALSAQKVRFVFRNTKVYGVILQNALVPEFLKSGVARSIELDLLARAFVSTNNKPNWWSILHSELRAMEQLDIPYFAANSDSDSLTIGVDQPLKEYFKAPSKSQVISRLQKLNETDLTRQIAIIRGTFYARVAQSPGTKQAGAASTLDEPDCSTQSLLTQERLLASANAIAKEIHKHAIKEASGSVSWIGLSYIPNAEQFQFQPLGNNLYDGNCGIALFLAALDFIRGSSEFRDLALGALESLRKDWQIADTQLTQKLAKRMGIGGATGLGSIIYSLAKISYFLKQQTLIEDAVQFANLITPEMIAADQQFDVMEGSAGAILGLLALYRQTTDAAILAKAIACGEHLLEHRISVDGSPKAWKTLEDKQLTGFSHGAAGIAYSLLQLYAVTHNNAYKEAALEGIAYERSVFCSTVANWPDFRSFDRQNGQQNFTVSWCHGASGIALARLGALGILQTEEIHQDVEVALQTTRKYVLQNVDNLCCGNFGRIEVLLVAAQKLSRPDLQEIAWEKAAQVIARAEQTGAYQLFANLPNHVFNPSFFSGTAGIGYELLRLAYPEQLPSLLLWE